MGEKTENKKLNGIVERFPKSELDRDKEKDLLSRIVMSPGIYDGAPTIRTTEVPIEVILGLLVAGSTEKEIRNILSLSEADMQAVFLYACFLVKEISPDRSFMAEIASKTTAGSR